jgi:ribosome-associated toxin RatA of RatAB toxin-antitoxin module
LVSNTLWSKETPDPKFETKESSQQNHAIVLSNKITFPFMVLEETWFLVPLQPMQTLDLKVRVEMQV